MSEVLIVATQLKDEMACSIFALSLLFILEHPPPHRKAQIRQWKEQTCSLEDFSKNFNQRPKDNSRNWVQKKQIREKW